jgi:hypothetical protein
MTNVLLELQEDYKKLREIVFNKKIIERSFVISKIQRCFYLGEYRKCIKECNKWIRQFPFDSDLHILYKTQSLFRLRKNNFAYKQLELFLSKNNDIISSRNFFYPLLSDTVAYKIILKKVPKEKVEDMKKIVEKENLAEKTFLVSNSELKQFFNSKK